MARQRRQAKPDPNESMLEEIESVAERGAAWVQANPRKSIAAVSVCLLLAGSYAGYDSWTTGREERASDALEQVQTAYLEAMGAGPDALELPELANPAAALQINQEYAERFRAVLEEHSGTVAAAVAALALGDVSEAAGDSAQTIEVWRAALADLPSDSVLRALLLDRMAQAHEDAGRWDEAGEAHAQAGEIEAFPLRYWALMDAARCFARAGQRQRALELFDRIATEAPDLNPPAHIRALLRELRAADGA